MKRIRVVSVVLSMALVIVLLPSKMQAAEMYPGAKLDAYAYDGDDLGTVYTPEETTFKVWAPSAEQVVLNLYTTGSDVEVGAKKLNAISMSKLNASNGVWSVTVEEDLVNVYYTYEVTTYGSTNEVVDIYAKAVGVNGNRGMIVDLNSKETNPDGWENDSRIAGGNQTDAVIYELHVRDFSAASSSGISEENKGKYLAFTETGTTLHNEGIHATGIDYIRDLSVTHIHLLPVSDFNSIDETSDREQYGWGYDPKNFNVPEGSYSSNPYDGNVRIREFKSMVQAIHNEGMGVILDVVYNHTAFDIHSWFHMTEPGYYHRMLPNGWFSNGSGCGNETASERAMMRKYMIDSIVYWATEYNIDGFRFDLMGLHDVTTMNMIREALDELPGGEQIIMYGEGWTAGPTAMDPGSIHATKDNTRLLNNRIASFSDNIRDAIKGNVFNSWEAGFIQGNGFTEEIKAGIQGNTSYGNHTWAGSPSQVVTYTSAHDNYSLWDKLIATNYGANDYHTRYEDLVKKNKLSASIVLTSQGIPFFQAGEEFARTKEGDHNSYGAPIAINQLDWERTVQFSDLVSYYQGLIELRQAYTPFRDATNTSARNIFYSWESNGFPNNVVAYTMHNHLTADTEFGTVAVLLNSNPYAQTVNLKTFDNSQLPNQWIVLVDDTAAGTDLIDTVEGTSVTVPARSSMVLVDREGYQRWRVEQDATKGMEIHYHNTNQWPTVKIYAYDEDENLLLNPWFDSPDMKYTGNGTWTYTLPAGIDYARVIFQNGSGSQDPYGVGSPGYEISQSSVIHNGRVMTY